MYNGIYVTHICKLAYVVVCVCVFERMLTRLFPCLSIFNLQFSAYTFSFSLLLTTSAATGAVCCKQSATTTTTTTTMTTTTTSCS